jgi:hypothetical protein
MKAYGGVDVQIHIFLTSALIGGEWAASHSGRFISGEMAPGTYGRGGWMEPRAGLDDTDKILDPRYSSPQPVAIPTALSRLPK